jgi:hypothetical protein
MVRWFALQLHCIARAQPIGAEASVSLKPHATIVSQLSTCLHGGWFLTLEKLRTSSQSH